MNEWMNNATEFHLKTQTEKLKLRQHRQWCHKHHMKRNKLLDTFPLTSSKDFVHDLQGIELRH